MDKKLRIRNTDTVLYVRGIMQVAEWTDRCDMWLRKDGRIYSTVAEA